MSNLLKFPRIFFLQMLTSFATVAAILFTPALPHISSLFELSTKQSQWPVTIYLFGFSLGPLLYGPLANRVGRKKTLLFGIFLAFAGSLLCLFSPSFLFFCLGRFIQALGAVAGLKIVFTMVSDVYKGPKAAKVLSILLLSFAIAPGLGLAIGGWLTEVFGWRSCFGFLALYSLALFLSSLTLPETIEKIDSSSLRLGHIFSRYLAQLKSAPLILCAVLMGSSVSMNYVFATEAPYVGIKIMNLSSGQYGLFGLVLSAGMLIGLLTSNYLAGRISSKWEISFGIFACLAGSCLMALFLGLNWMTGWSLFLPQALIQMGVGIIWVFAPTKSLSLASDKSNASAVTQFLSMSIATTVTLLAGILFPKELFVIPIVGGLLSLFMLGIWRLLIRRCPE